MTKNLSALQNTLGYTFRDESLLITALTHSTYANAHGTESNERLEYLGDAVLQLIVTERQYRMENADEGTLTKRRQEKVCEGALLSAVRRMGLECWLRYEGSVQNVGKKTWSSLYESVLAAIYLDGGMDAAKAFVRDHAPGEESRPNAKGDLQEYLQGKGLLPPVYTDKQTDDGFESVAEADGETALGAGNSKRAAQQLAAEGLLRKLKGKRK